MASLLIELGRASPAELTNIDFLTFVKLTFGNGLKKLGLLDDPDAFNFNNIEYNGPTIHELISAADQDRFDSQILLK